MKKGFSLVEIIISVGLIAVVMLFLFQILTDLQYEESTSNYATNNHCNFINLHICTNKWESCYNLILFSFIKFLS